MIKKNEKENNKKSCAKHQKLFSGQDDDLEVFGYVRSYLKSFLVHTACFLTFGILWLIFYWNPHIYLYSTYKKCCLNQASKVLILNDYKGKFRTYYITNVKTISVKNYRKSNQGQLLKDDIEKLKKMKFEMCLENDTLISSLQYRAFWCKKLCYVWDDKNSEFSRIITIDKHTYCPDLYKSKNSGLPNHLRILRRIIYGYNEINVPVHSIPQLIFMKIFEPLNIIYELSLAVWVPMGYYCYASVLLFLILFGGYKTIAETRRNQLRLRKKVLETNETVRVLINKDTFKAIPSVELVPGDIFELPRNKQGIISCDAILLSGACIVNESMLTGESTPIIKSALQPWEVMYNQDKHSNHTLFCGTTILQTKNYGTQPILAQVIRTGIQTSKGALISAILYPPALGFEFEKESNKIISIILSIALCGFVYTVISKNLNGISEFALLQAFSVFSLVVPPALPVLLLLAASYSQSRLKKAGIFCTDTRVINEAGKINCCCFDKTGTLTEEKLDLFGVMPSVDNELKKPEKDSSTLKNYSIFEGLAVCHSLLVIRGEIFGNAVDQKMFEITGWSLGETKVKESQVGRTIRTVYSPSGSLFPVKMKINIIQQYLFSSELQRMSVIVQLGDSGRLRVYTKGSPEMILSLCKSESHPENFTTVLRKYTEKGCRVIALATSEFNEDDSKLQIIPREKVEKDLKFLGFVVFKNQLKSSTIDVVNELKEANIRTIMITGDNVQTAVNIARECKMITNVETLLSFNVETICNEEKPNLILLEEGFFSKQVKNYFKSFNNKSVMNILERGLDSGECKLVLTGKMWNTIYKNYPDLVPRVCAYGIVFARMTINQKRQVIVELMKLGYNVAMCGDGANDCAALKAAHIGISLSETQSGVASSFTSTVPDITCVPLVIKEGRATLVSSFGLFKFILICCLIEFTSTIILYSVNLKISDFQYMFIEIGLTLSINFSFGNTKPSDTNLINIFPITSLINFTQILSFTVHTMVIVIMQVTVLLMVQHQTWYETSESSIISYENYSIFCLSMFQYIISAVIFSTGKPHRQPIYTNYLLVVCLIFLASVSFYLTVGPDHWVVEVFVLRVPPTVDWRWKIIVFAIFNAFICIVFEKIILKWIELYVTNFKKDYKLFNNSSLTDKSRIFSNRALGSVAIDCREIYNRNIKKDIVEYENSAFVHDDSTFRDSDSKILNGTKL